MAKRDQSKLLVSNGGKIIDDQFRNIADHLPGNSLLVFNETKVVQARISMHKATGAAIEIFCLGPEDEQIDLQQAFQQTSPVKWKCLVGNAKKWKEGTLVKEIICKKGQIRLEIEKLESKDDYYIIGFKWDNLAISFSEILENAGNTPIPPYLNRKSEISDCIRYQTVYARNEGSVAAPTAGLHFTIEVFDNIAAKGIQKAFLNLHVGAGTFKPVDSNKVINHQMHTEQMVFEREFIQEMIENTNRFIVPVGTTSVRSLESLYWFGVKLMTDTNSLAEFSISQFEVYDLPRHISRKESIQAVLDFMNTHKLDVLIGGTRLMILPGYAYKMVDALITNFHQPKSTLLLLVAALIGDHWKDVYEYALQNNFRFLSYGDSCLFFNSSVNPMP